MAWLVLLLPFTLAVGRRLGSPLLTGLAVSLVWLASLAAADALERRGHPGPAERVLPRLTYGRR